jgi:hypothetical protein
MPQSPKTTGFMQTTPTIKSEMDAKCLSANSTTNNNTIFNFPAVKSATTATTSDESAIRKSVNENFNSNAPAMSHHEGKNMGVTDINVNVNVIASCASSNHEKISTSCCPSMSSSDSSKNTNNSTKYINNQSSSNNIISTSTSTNNINNINNNNINNINKINVINVCDGSDSSNGIIIAETHEESAGYYDTIKLEENGATAIIYETIVIENPSSHQSQELMGLVSGNSNINNNNNKFITNKNHISLEVAANKTQVASTNGNNNNGGGIIVLTGSLNDLLLSQNGHVLTNNQPCQSQFNGGLGNNIKCLNDVKNQIQSIVLNLNSQSSATATTISSTGQVSMGNQQQSIMLAINPAQQVRMSLFS